MDERALIRLSDEARRTRAAIDLLLRHDERDASDIPGYVELADRLIAIVDDMARTPSETAQGLLMKARAIDPRDAEMRSDSAVALALSVAQDVIAIIGRP